MNHITGDRVGRIDDGDQEHVIRFVLISAVRVVAGVPAVRVVVGVVRIEVAILLRRLELRLHLICGLSVERMVVEVGLRDVVEVRLIRRPGDALVCGWLHGQVVRVIEGRLLVRWLRYQVVGQLILGHFKRSGRFSGGGPSFGLVGS